MTNWETWRELLTGSDAAKTGAELYREYTRHGYVARTCREILRLPDAAIIDFYTRLEHARPLRSPVAGEKDSRWMQNADFCFVNIRATGIGDTTGNFLQAAKLLPAIRANAIHLAPFTLCDFDIIYAIRSFKSINPALAVPALTAAGFHTGQQLRALVDAAHLLDKTIGFDLEPHVTQFAIPVLMHPDLFRWIKLDPLDKLRLDYGQSNEEMLEPVNQRRIAEAVRQMVTGALQQQSFDTLEYAPDDSPEMVGLKTDLYQQLVTCLIREGYWTILSHTWSGVGVPEFAAYHPNNYPTFRYLNRRGEKSTDKIFGVLTPFKFYDGIPPNRIPEHPPMLNPAALDYFCSIFPYWRDHYGFDFVRYDSVDHIFDSAAAPDFPLSDRPSPTVLATCIQASKAPDKPSIGSLAEHMGNESDQYGELGFDVVLGNTMLEMVGEPHLRACFGCYQALHTSQNTVTVAYAVDTHDTGDPHLWGEPLLKKVGSSQLLMRQFIARFISVGKSRRPKYEVMGVQDMSYGLYEANVHVVNLHWAGDKAHNRRYHYLEDVYQAHRELLSDAHIIQYHVTDRYAWWVIRASDTWLIPVVNWQPGHVHVDYASILPFPIRQITQYDFEAMSDVILPPSDARLIDSSITLIKCVK